MEYTTLSNGVKMPMLGYGVFQIGNAETEECVSEAIKAGYRLIDTAQSYGNEEGVGAAIAKSGVPRDELFIVSKIWVSNYRYEDAKRSIVESLERLGLEYLDLMLLHQAYYDVYGAWRALEEAYAEGKVRAIGVSNFDSKQLMDLCAFAEVKPMLNQVETHVFWQEKPEHAVMEKLGVQHMAWGPFAEGANGFFTNPLLAKIGEKYGKGVGQVALRFLMDEGVIVIPKSSKPARMAENFDVFDFELTEDDREQIRGLDAGKSVILDHHNLDTVQFLLDRIKGQIDAAK